MESKTDAGESQQLDQNELEFIAQAVRFYLGILHCFEASLDPPNNPTVFDKLADMLRNLSMRGREFLFKELVRKIEEEPYLFCSFCHRFMFTPRQTFMHVMSPKHACKKKNAFSQSYLKANSLLIKMVGQQKIADMYEQEEMDVKSQKSKYQSISLKNSELRHIKNEFKFNGSFRQLALVHGNGNPTEYPEYLMATALVSELKEDVCQRIKQDIDSHIGSAKTCCLACKLIFADAAEYHEHLLTFYHMNNADPFDTVTLVVNMHKRHLESKKPWPEMTQ